MINVQRLYEAFLFFLADSGKYGGYAKLLVRFVGKFGLGQTFKKES